MRGWAALTWPRLNALLADMAAEAAAVVAAGSLGAPVRQVRTAYMRYVGQGHEIPVALSLDGIGDPAALRAEYERAYARIYDRPVPGSDVEVMSYAVTVATVPDGGPDAVAPAAVAGQARRQRVRDTATGVVSDWAVHDRAALGAGATVAGPAIIAEDETSTLVGPGWTATVDGRGYLDLRRGA